MEYNHENRSKFAFADCNAAVGQRATLTLTGEIVDAGESDFGPYVKFEVDERWGFGEHHRFVMDLDALQIQPKGTP